MKRQKILIIDDSKLNREILTDMLCEKYEICEAENGAQAVEILEQNWKNLKLVLLDLKMPVMDGYEVLSIMNKRQWLDALPVICISSETSGESIRRSYELGASDYFTRPFDSSTVIHRVDNTILLHEKMAGGLQDAMTMLSTIFYQVLRLNLTADTYTILRGKEAGFSNTHLSDCMKMMVDCGYIYEEDQKEYLKFCDIDNMRRQMASGSGRLALNYRCRVKNEFRWVCMEIIRSSEYSPDNEIAMMYIRDVNDEYLKQLDMIVRRAKDAVATVTVNVSEGICVIGSSTLESLELKEKNEPYDQYIDRISRFIPQKEKRAHFVKRLSIQNLQDCFHQGKDMITEECPVYGEKGISLRMIRITVEMIRNSSYNILEAMFYFSDVTEHYLAEKIPHMLYQKNFDKIAIIDEKKDYMKLDTPGVYSTATAAVNKVSYSGHIAKVMEQSVPDDERFMYRKCTQIDTIRKELHKKGRYSFTVHQLNGKGEKRLKSYTYFYLDKFFGIIICTVEDITEKFDQDILTGGYNRQGFIRHVGRILQESEDKTQYAIVFFDIKNFKAVNELFGTEIGDMVLRKMYRDIRNSGLEPLVAAREDADHFICLVERRKLCLDMLTEMCQQKMTRAGKTLHLSAKCGIFMIEEKSMSVNGMIDRAKIAKKYITDEFVQAYRIYDSSMKNAYIDKAELAGELEEGIAQGQFKVFFQPVVDAKTGRITAAESLIRWFHPEKGFISPGIFIPALEESGHISELYLRQ